jgi:N-acyl-D-amino-acid deacylase
VRAHVVIRNGRVLDGTGAQERRAEVAIRDGRIAAIGEGFHADEAVDAAGRIVAPGFIDLHSHGDLVLAWPSDERLALLEGRIAQGITTEIVGNCGLGVCPLFARAGEILPALNGWMTPASFPWTWASTADYFTHLERLGLPVNVGALAPHGPLRLGVRALGPGETNAEERRRMGDALDGALEEGAFGLSAGLIYPPGMYTSTEELASLASRAARRGGVFTCHVRGSSETLLDAVSEILRIGAETGVRVHHSHAEAVGRSHWPKLARFIEMEEAARAEGVSVTLDMFPYTVAATMMLAIFPPWALEGGIERLLGRLADGSEREWIRASVETQSPSWPPWREGGWPHNLVKAVGWDRIRVSSVGSDRNRSLEGLTLAELGRARGRDPFDAIADVMIEEGGNVGQFVEDISGEAGIRALAKRSDVAFITDANDYGKGRPHPAAYGSFPRVLGRFVREERLLTLPEAIRRMSGLPAEILGLRDRGVLREGAHADVVVLDPEAIEDRATLEEPRLRARGVDVVFVNGKAVYRKGGLTGALPGAILRHRSSSQGTPESNALRPASGRA